MRFAILGDHDDGWRLARALRASGRHEVATYAGMALAPDRLAEWPRLRIVSDIEEPLADPGIDAVIVSGPLDSRLDALRRTLQSERPAFCVHPVDVKPDGGFEINLLQGDLHQVALPIMPEAFAPALESARREFESASTVLDAAIESSDEFAVAEKTPRPVLPGWSILRRIGGDIAEIAAFAAGEFVTPGQPITATGEFKNRRLFRILWTPGQKADSATFAFTSSDGTPTSIAVEPDAACWCALIERFEELVARLPTTPRAAPGSGPAQKPDGKLTWLDEIRALELNEAVRYGMKKRRSYVLDYQEGNEEVGFKSTMTLVGCGLIWLIPVLLVISAWFPLVGWTIGPLLAVFLGVQLLRRVTPTPVPTDDAPSEPRTE